MGKKDLIKNLLLGFIPIFTFSLAEESLGLVNAVFLSVISGVVIFLYYLISMKQKEWFVLIDTGLVLIFGLISIQFNDDIFFKIKPGIVQCIVLAMFSMMLFSNEKILSSILGRYNKNLVLNSEHVQVLRKQMIPLYVIITLHTVLIFIAAFKFSTASWSFIAGPLFYIILGLYFGFSYTKNYFRMKKL
ncbi:MAG: septation protein IspZ [Candidatus Delongbacteria bacterium]|nr:septation protein IspZ [Candidatus Delongbacteria bacterium]MBN2836210.1 septation protein IspZ [Candidatus Delongbacteria bacterium]